MLCHTYQPIPQNKKNNFIITKGDWNYTIDVKFNQNEVIDMANLFAILKSYVLNDEHAVKYVLTIAQNNLNEKKISTFTQISINKLKKIDFLDFLDYYEILHDRDYEYIASHEFYGFRVLFYPESLFWQKNIIYPIFPWSGLIKNLILKKTPTNAIKNLTNRSNQRLRQENFFLKKKIFFLRKKNFKK